MTIDEYSATLPVTTNGFDRVAVGLDYCFTHHDDLLQRLADDPPVDNDEDGPPGHRP